MTTLPPLPFDGENPWGTKFRIWSNALREWIATKADAEHTHTVGSIPNLESLLNGKTPEEVYSQGMAKLENLEMSVLPSLAINLNLLKTETIPEMKTTLEESRGRLDQLNEVTIPNLIESLGLVGETAAQAKAAADAAIVDSVVEYAQNTSNSTPPETGWSSTAPTHVEGQYIWMRTVVEYGDSTYKTSSPVMLTGDAGVGEPGADGISVSSITPYFQLVVKGGAVPAKPTTMTPSGWSVTEPDYVAQRDLYRVERIVFSNNSFSYTEVYKVSAYTGLVTLSENLSANETVLNNLKNITLPALDDRLAEASKNVSVKETPPSTTTGYPIGAYWIQINGAKEEIGHWTLTASGWQATPLSDTIIPKLQSGVVTTAILNAGDALVDQIAGRVATFLELNADQITSGFIDTGRLRANEVAAAVGEFLELNAGQIKAGLLDSERINVTSELTARIADIIELRAESIKAVHLSAQTVELQQMAANIGSFMEINVSQLFADAALINSGVISKLYSQIFEANKITANEINLGVDNRTIVINGNGELGTNEGFSDWQYEAADKPEKTIGAFKSDSTVQIIKETNKRVKISPFTEYILTFWTKKPSLSDTAVANLTCRAATYSTEVGGTAVLPAMYDMDDAISRPYAETRNTWRKTTRRFSTNSTAEWFAFRVTHLAGVELIAGITLRKRYGSTNTSIGGVGVPYAELNASEAEGSTKISPFGIELWYDSAQDGDADVELTTKAKGLTLRNPVNKTVAASFTTSGVVSENASFTNVSLGGVPLSDALEVGGRGIIHAGRGAGPVGNVGQGGHAIMGSFTFKALANRAYIFEVVGPNINTADLAVAQFRIKQTDATQFGPPSASLSDPIDTWGQALISSWNALSRLSRLIGEGGFTYDRWITVLYSIFARTGALDISTFEDQNMFHYTITDIGPSPISDVFTSKAQFVQPAAPAPTSPVPVTETFDTWTATKHFSYKNNGSARSGAQGQEFCMQGYTSFNSSYGVQSSVIFFDDVNIRSKLYGATITKTEVYIKNEHWHASSGGNIFLRTHNFANTDNPTSHGGGVDLFETHMAKGEGNWYQVPNSFGTELRDNASKGFMFFPKSTSSLYYGYHKREELKIRVHYRK